MKQSYFFESKQGLSDQSIDQLIRAKNEPDWMKDFRKKGYRFFLQIKIAGY